MRGVSLWSDHKFTFQVPIGPLIGQVNTRVEVMIGDPLVGVDIGYPVILVVANKEIHFPGEGLDPLDNR